MARIPLDAPTTLFSRAARAYTRLRYGARLEPAEATLHAPRVGAAYALWEVMIGRWRGVDPGLKGLAVMAAANRIGCSWCLDFGHWEQVSQGVSAERLRAVPRWRDSDLFDATERAVMAYAEAMTGEVASEVTDAMVADLVDRLGVPAVVEVTMMVAVENQRSRFNSALGLATQGFSDRCEVPG